MKQLDKRILRLERAYELGPKKFMLLGEFQFLVAFPNIWPDREAAPKFALTEYDRFIGLVNQYVAANQESKTGSSTESPAGGGGACDESEPV